MESFNTGSPILESQRALIVRAMNDYIRGVLLWCRDPFSEFVASGELEDRDITVLAALLAASLPDSAQDLYLTLTERFRTINIENAQAQNLSLEQALFFWPDGDRPERKPSFEQNLLMLGPAPTTTPN